MPRTAHDWVAFVLAFAAAAVVLTLTIMAIVKKTPKRVVVTAKPLPARRRGPSPRASTEIPQAVIDAVAAEFKKNKFTKRQDVTAVRVKEYLRKLRMSQHYEHRYVIAVALGGAPPPKMSQELEDKLKAMFDQTQEPFARHCPKTRCNFLNYNYTLHKLCELLSADEYLQYFPLLKGTTKLYQQDQIWKKICQDLGWQFIPSGPS